MNEWLPTSTLTSILLTMTALTARKIKQIACFVCCLLGSSGRVWPTAAASGLRSDSEKKMVQFVVAVAAA